MPPKLVNQKAGLYSGTEGPVKCDDTIPDHFAANTGVRQVCGLAPQHSSTLASTIWGQCRDGRATGCRSELSGSLILTVRTTRLYPRRHKNFSRRLESLSQGAEPLGSRVFRLKTKIQAFGDILGATIESIHVSGENVVVMLLRSAMLGDPVRWECSLGRSLTTVPPHSTQV